ncbi:MAG: NAD(P)/FAD-dependent oxidoreductase [Dehalococcoidia bacterium]|nr:MAG: NAD(P)/FAD-dependent oxidoreductase [Dehalococcoidia bacterium]
MADATFDAVIVGGGNKALLLAMYLIKFGGMSVGIFERRHEIGGCLATEESSAPGFRGNTHANIMLPWYYVPVWRDFPEFWDYGAQIDQYTCSDGAIFRNNQTCLTIYSEKHDPTQERTAKEIARFSEKDADRWLKYWTLWQSDETQKAQMDMLFNPAEFRLAPEVMNRQIAVFPKLLEAGIVPDSLLLASSHLRAAKDFWESKELQYCQVRFALSGTYDVADPGAGQDAIGFPPTMATIGFARGGTHQIAHAAHQVLVQNGCQFFTHAEVEKVIIENGSATGIRLTDGTEVRARKLVVSTLSPQQLCFDLIGREYLDYKLIRRVEQLEAKFGCLMWYSFALHEPPKYEAAAFNPDINQTYWLGLSMDNDPERVAREAHYSRLGQWPPLEDYCPVVWCHSLVDPSYAPPGKHVAQNEQLGPPASAHTEREWLEIKRRYAEELVSIWREFAPNMTWDNIIGVDTNSPYDNLRMRNLAPDGSIGLIDRNAYQVKESRPTPELANHRTPIKNLYATGAAWHLGASASASESYNCYKIIATDLGLGKPWEEPGKEDPDSLVEVQKKINKGMQDSLRTRKA